jgi:hypothetical protein
MGAHSGYADSAIPFVGSKFRCQRSRLLASETLPQPNLHSARPAPGTGLAVGKTCSIATTRTISDQTIRALRLNWLSSEETRVQLSRSLALV